ncbi:rRNA methyltransferase [Nonomuraea purpurea]|uniref:rRNA methyltransferase n=1 Tax=Nonomuraea purpurea TaxID=1849276 RepID=A0ABV8GNE3_9ACTN
MVYLYETARVDYSDLASGSVLHSAPGMPAFPVRLATEIFQRALALRGGADPAVVWDPCCGSGYLLTVLALLHRPRVKTLLASDLSEDVLGTARANLNLLTETGLRDRAAELADRAERFGKPGYALAAEAAERLARRLAASGGPVPHHVLRPADVFDPAQLAAAIDGDEPDIVLTDPPYDEQTSWQGSHQDKNLPAMMAALGEVLPPHTVVAVAVRGRRVPAGAGVRPRQSLRIGTRAVAFFAAADLTVAGRRSSPR